MRWRRHNEANEARQQCRAWFRAVMHRLLAYARIQAGDENDVEMLLSGVMERVVEAVAEGRVPATEDNLMPYCMRAIRHSAIRLRRRNMHRREAELAFSASPEGHPTEEHPRHSADDASLRAERLRRAVQLLPEEHAELVELHIWQELSFAEIARRTDTPESTLLSRYLVALQSIKNHLSTAELC